MSSTDSVPLSPGRWTSLWVVALLSLVAQLWLCQFFSLGREVPYTIDINPSNLWKFAYHFPPTGSFEVLNWLGVANLPPPLNPFTLGAHLSPWFFFTAYAPVMATCSLLAMAAFLREFGCPRPAALFGAVIYAWQGDLLSFVFPAHFAYITTWPFFAVAAWGALRAQRTAYWPYAVMSGAGCGLMVELQPDRGAIASLLIAALYLGPVTTRVYLGEWVADSWIELRHFALCVGVALAIALASFLALFQGNIVGVTLGSPNGAGQAQRDLNYKFVTQFSLGPEETLTYPVPGLFGWHTHSEDGPYWGRIGEWPDWGQKHEGTRNLNLAISTTGTVAAILGLIGACVLLPGALLGGVIPGRQRLYGRIFFILGLIALILAWGYHTPFYRQLYVLPFMDKWRNPLKWLEITNFALITLSALGMQHVLTSLDLSLPEFRVVRSRLVWVGGVMVALFSIGLLASYPFSLYRLAAQMAGDGYEPLEVSNAMRNLHASWQFALVMVVLACLLVIAVWLPTRLRTWTLPNPWLNRLWQGMWHPDLLGLTLALGLALLSAIQLGWVTGKFVFPTDLSVMTASNPLLDALRNESTAVRCSVAVEDPQLNVLLLNQFNNPKISCLDISAASRIPDDLKIFFNALDNNRARLWMLAGVKNVAVPQQDLALMRTDAGVVANIAGADGYTLIATGSPSLPSHAVVTMRDYLAKATLVPEAETLPLGALLKRLPDPEWDPRKSILLEASAALPPPPSPQPSATLDEVDLTAYTNTDIDLDVQSIHGGYILINDQFDPDWRVQLNGKPAPLLRADYILRAIAVPPGVSTLRLHYASRYHIGALLSQMIHRQIGDFAPSAWVLNLFSDGAMLAAWLLAALALWAQPERRMAPLKDRLVPDTSPPLPADR